MTWEQVWPVNLWSCEKCGAVVRSMDDATFECVVCALLKRSEKVTFPPETDWRKRALDAEGDLRTARGALYRIQNRTRQVVGTYNGLRADLEEVHREAMEALEIT